MPTRFELSWASGPIGDAAAFPVLPIEEALAHRYQSDVHALSYRITGRHTTPRVKREMADAASVVSDVVFLDLDRPGHAPWDSPEQAFLTFYALVKIFPNAAVYTTKGGARLVFKLEALKSPDRWGRAATTVMLATKELIRRAALPLEMDELSAQWTRCFRLPNVIRDGQPTWESPYYNLHIPAVWTTVRGFAMNPTETRIVMNTELAETEVEEINAERVLSDDEWTALARDLNPRLFDWPTLLDDLRHGRRFYVRGQRNDTTFRALKVVFEAYYAVYRKDDPSVLFAMFRASAAASTGTPPDESVAELFGMVSRMAHVEAYMHDPVHDIKATREVDTPFGLLPMIVYQPGQGRYVWDPAKNAYSAPIVNDTNFVSLVRSNHGAEVPGLLDLKLQSMLDGFGTFVDGVVLDLRVDRPRIDIGPNGRKLILPVGQRVEVKPAYYEEIDEWLEMLGGDDVDGLLTWLKFATTHDRPKAALYLAGASRAGKSMIAEAIAAFYGGQFVKFSQAVDKFNASIRDAPFIWLEETAGEVTGDVTGPFRALTANSSHSVMAKFAMPETLKGCLTMLVTANGEEALPLDKIKTPDDVKAIQARVRFIRVKPETTAWLKQRGGRAFTSDWVTMPDGSPGKLCQHIAWLRDNYQPLEPTDQDFVVSGNSTPWHVKALYNGVVGVVLRLVADAVARNNPAQAHAFFDRQRGLLVDSISIFQGLSTMLRQEGVKIGEAREALHSLSKDEHTAYGKTWSVLDTNLLVEMPRYCYPSAGAYDAVMKLVRQQEAA